MDRNKMQKLLPFEIPEWFSIGKYSYLNELSCNGWGKLLWERRYFIYIIKDSTSDRTQLNLLSEFKEVHTRTNFKEDNSKQVIEGSMFGDDFEHIHWFAKPVRPAYVEDLILHHSIAISSKEVKNLKDEMTVNGYTEDALNSQPNLTDSELILYSGYLASDVIKIDSPERALITPSCYLTFEEDYKPATEWPTNDIITVDLAATDEELINSFKETLVELRKVTDVNSKKNAFKKAHFKKWINHRAIEYIDLMILASIHEVKIEQHALGEIIFHDQLNIDTTEKIRKTTKPLVEFLLSNTCISALKYQEESEKK